jgi:hypothetical protein
MIGMRRCRHEAVLNVRFRDHRNGGLTADKSRKRRSCVTGHLLRVGAFIIARRYTYQPHDGLLPNLLLANPPGFP